MAIHKIAIIGANGNLGPFVLSALTAESSFQIAVLSRASSKSTYQSSVTDVRIPDAMDHPSLVSALRGFDALVMCFNGFQTETSLKLADAALEAGVQRVIPADFGSCDSSDPRSLSLVPLFKEKEKVRNHLISLCAKSNEKMTWTSIITGHFLDHGLQGPLLGFSLQGEDRHVNLFDGGNVKFSCSTLEQIGKAVVQVLLHAEQTRNKLLYIQSLSTTQNELKKIIETVTGSQLEIKQVDAEQYIAELKKQMEIHEGDRKLTEDMVSVEGIVNAFWETKAGFANEYLGLQEENLEELVRKTLAS